MQQVTQANLNAFSRLLFVTVIIRRRQVVLLAFEDPTRCKGGTAANQPGESQGASGC